MTTKNGQEELFTGKACKKIYGNRTFKLTIQWNISHDDYCIFDGTLCVAAFQRPLGSFVYGAPLPGEDNNSQVFSKKGPQVSNPRHLANRSPHGSPTRQTRNDAVTLTADARDERCEVWVQVWPCVDPSVKLSCARLFHRFSKNTLPARKKKTSIDKTKSRLQNHEWNRVEQKPDLQPVVFASCANFLMTLQEQNAFHTARTDISCGMSRDKQLLKWLQFPATDSNTRPMSWCSWWWVGRQPGRTRKLGKGSRCVCLGSFQPGHKGDACDLEKGSKKGKETQIMSDFLPQFTPEFAFSRPPKSQDFRGI